MPNNNRIPDQIKRDALTEYYNDSFTVDQICVRHGIKRRTLYSWIERAGQGTTRIHNHKAPRANLRLSREEVELILLMCSESEKILPRKLLSVMRPLEDRLLEAADTLEELTRT